MFQQAVNYVFTGRIDPPDAPEIADRNACIVVVPDTKFKRHIRYYLKRFKMDGSRINKTYAGAQAMYELEVGGSDIVVEFLNIEKTKVDFGLKTAHISLPGNIDQAERALRRIFDDYCRPEKPKLPFQQLVARMERSVIRSGLSNRHPTDSPPPDCAALHPGYGSAITHSGAGVASTSRAPRRRDGAAPRAG